MREDYLVEDWSSKILTCLYLNIKYLSWFPTTTLLAICIWNSKVLFIWIVWIKYKKMTRFNIFFVNSFLRLKHLYYQLLILWIAYLHSVRLQILGFFFVWSRLQILGFFCQPQILGQLLQCSINTGLHLLPPLGFSCFWSNLGLFYKQVFKPTLRLEHLLR